MARFGQAVSLTIAVVACGTPTDPWIDLITETARAEFVLEEAVVAVPFTVTNLSAGTTYYLDACAERPNAAIERREGLRWVTLHSGICPGVLQGPPLSLRPGRNRPSFVAIREPGVYRLRLGVRMGSGRQTEWSEMSNTFVVRRGR